MNEKIGKLGQLYCGELLAKSVSRMFESASWPVRAKDQFVRVVAVR